MNSTYSSNLASQWNQDTGNDGIISWLNYPGGDKVDFVSNMGGGGGVETERHFIV